MHKDPMTRLNDFKRLICRDDLHARDVARLVPRARDSKLPSVPSLSFVSLQARERTTLTCARAIDWISRRSQALREEETR
jgi:hypothetical protein